MKNMERSYLIIHGLNGSGEGHWQNWLYKELLKRGENVLFPQLPNKEEPVRESWIKELERNMIELNGEKIVICHSLGAYLWLLYSQKEDRVTADRVLLVAPPGHKEAEVIARGFKERYIDSGKLKSSSRELRLVVSENDEYCSKNGAVEYGRNLGIDTDILPPEAGHINIKSGYGSWNSVLDWALDGSIRIKER